MDFFEAQDRARKKTKFLVFYFILAIIGITASVYVTASLLTRFAEGPEEWAQNGWQIPAFDPGLLLICAAGTTLLIGLGSGFKILQVSGGGAAVARDLGGRRIDPQTADYHERRLVNVVEEMAIAAGVPVPDIYLLDAEEGINAFAAGKNPSDAAIGVTRGCLHALTRDELQGVIGHEFSHVLNGDMRLNLRLLGLLHGILILTILGRIVMRVTFFSGGGRSSNGKGGGAAILAIILFGIALFIIGSIGVFFGKLIKSAVSRQREFLADSSAVQFTRNPAGLAGALKKIGGLTTGSRLQDPRAEEASHMFFANGMAESFMARFSTHPPLSDRILALEPDWDGAYPEVDLPQISSGMEAEVPVPPPMSSARVAGLDAGSSEVMLAGLGQLRDTHLEAGRSVRASLPQPWVDLLHNSSGAQALIFALILAEDNRLRATELRRLEQSTDPETYSRTRRLYEEIDGLHSSRKIALIDMSLPALRRLSAAEYERFLAVMDDLIASDEQIDLFEFMLQKIVKRHLDLYFNRIPPARIRYRKIGELAEDAAVLLTTLAALGHEDENGRKEAFGHGAAALDVEVAFQPGSKCGLQRIDEALRRFDASTPLVKKQLLYACAKVVMADHEVVSHEAELLRAVADTIGCPIPPFVGA